MLQYRFAAPQDFKAVYELYMDGPANLFLTYDPMEENEFQVIFDELLVTQTLYVVLLENEVVGTYRLIPKTHRQRDTIYLGGLAVKTSQKGKGFGAKMLQHIKEEAIKEGKKRIELTVDLHNNAAISLYKKTGFEIEGTIRKSYKLSTTNEYYDEYLMALIL